MHRIDTARLRSIVLLATFAPSIALAQDRGTDLTVPPQPSAHAAALPSDNAAALPDDNAAALPDDNAAALPDDSAAAGPEANSTTLSDGDAVLAADEAAEQKVRMLEPLAPEPLAPAYELQLGWFQMPQLSLAIPIGSHVHLELAVVGAYWNTNTEAFGGLDTSAISLGGGVRVRFDLLPPEAAVRPFVRVGGELGRTWYQQPDGIGCLGCVDSRSVGTNWAARVGGGVQVRLHRHFGIEAEAGLQYATSHNERSFSESLSLHYGGALIVYI